MDLNLDKLVYLDAEYISRKYEEIKKINPGSTFTKQEGANVGVKIPLLSGGIHAQESRTFAISSWKMLVELWEDLNKLYKNFEDVGFKNYSGTKILWMTGNLTIAEWVKSGSNEPEYKFYQLDHGSKRTAFLTHQEYFSAGFAEGFNASIALKGNIGIPVRCLVKVMWHVDIAENYTACPYLIVEETGS